MDGDTLYSIGELARRTGLTVKAIRFYSDCGIVPPTGRSPAGHRLYDIDAAARLELVRTLRDLGIDLPTIRKVLDRELSLAQVAAAHAEALATQIRVLRLRRAVATAVARRGSTPEEMYLMHRLARLSDGERRRLIDGFLDAAFGGLDAGLTGIRRTMTPELPDDPEDGQVEAWIELAELAADPEFGALMRRVTEQHLTDHVRGDVPRPGAVAMVRDHVAPALAAGVGSASPQADAVVASVAARYADLVGHPDDTALRRRLLTLLETANDPRRESYLRLLAVVNGWPPPDPLAPALTWFVAALRARTS
ncbi:MerR family transcriptional regulator [Microbispora bryophytorum]|uniref:MerR family transcriptional regulator n=1 Tax=Microbispora bryophytorum TaxID=1460882 RepID=A0A8H9H0H5_9ACTN|nr:MerR family transcriptional regulator [Microbispora bryophytorum]MBD3139194.1 MerR family transcriptional regulator [Microbispora bryophytorum]TQS03334.1 MerR family transcriptional regulator [Microbispora bryophytorum]GGO15835.1 MerR family transcriptional regulator [Microbispora bryophytorum]